jgi:hypothetical protein
VKLGIYVSPRTVRAFWPPGPARRGHRRTSSQNWRKFVRNHAQSIVACDFLVVVDAHENWRVAHRPRGDLRSRRASFPTNVPFTEASPIYVGSLSYQGLQP